jgi:hypothetical protein
MNFEGDLQVGMQTSAPVIGQLGFGGAISSVLLADISTFVYSSLDLYGVAYLDKNVLFKELNYGLGTNIPLFSGLVRLTLGGETRFYEGLTDHGFRAGVGIGSRINSIETTLNYYQYINLEKQSVVFNIGFLF